MEAKVIKLERGAEYYFREGCFITELSNSADDPEVSVARARVQPGTTTRWHRLAGCAERYVILEGSGRVEVGQLAATADNPGDVVIIPAGERQRITNTGGRDLVFLALCTPPFDPVAYEELED